MKKTIAIIASAAMLIGLAACGSTTASEEPTPTKTPTTATPTKTAEKNERGHLVKHIGDTAMYTKSQSSTEPLAEWTATDITIDYQCTADYSEQSHNGHYVAVNFDVQTQPEFTQSSLYLGAMGGWKYIQKDGTMWNGIPEAETVCMPQEEQLPGSIGAGVKAQGKVLFDLPTTDGYLVYDDTWEYPLS
ncbi:hypothetical protein [Bifidobacterium vansinderenii]|uniref:DUF4352 domain-containing protein n=1 Tax=Bifidobacterium vansinderenii TaxID=1984871 RepID=A0A229W0R9_9BIFI|nr:hypothetical protein [Bifidobacterium vansinderenii]OXN01442.1 hypothetical protein Tam10B_0445 [Bifidobacterium vansinderenii]